MLPVTLQEESRLPQPPEAQYSIRINCGRSHVSEKRLILLKRLGHHRSLFLRPSALCDYFSKPISFLTTPTPSTMFISFCRAAHRAV